MMETISSKENPHVKQLARLLTQKKERDACGCFVAEGARLCMDAADSGIVITQLFLTDRAIEKYPRLEGLLTVAGRVLWISETLAERISDTKSPQGVFAVCSKPDHSADALLLRENGRYLLLTSMQDPGNVGAILRTAQAMGLDGVFVSDDCPDLYAPKVLRATMGGLFRLPMAVCGDMHAVIARLREQSVAVYAAALTDASVPVDSIAFDGAAAMVIGNEGNGLAPDLIAACTASVIIPMAGGADSLNAAMAAGILMWEMRKQKPAGRG